MQANTPRRSYGTPTAAGALGIKPASLNTALWRHGHYCGIRPSRLPNGRLLWPADEIDALAAGARAHEAPDFSARLSAGRAAAAQ